MSYPNGVPEGWYTGSNASTVGSRSRSSTVVSLNSNAEIEEPTPQNPYSVDDPIRYTNAGAEKIGKITEVLPIGNGTYGYILADGTYLPHSRIIGIKLSSGQGGGARRKRVHKLSRRKSRRGRRFTRRR